jgi:3-oxoacyl-[acyl-carrier protein] reductase|tara:strand:- start:5605 stop:6357 length:753 start_codon:yes stop_codon:yes gene_type:complete
MDTLFNKTIIVTGGSRGIGRAIALHLAGSGANVCVNYHVNRNEAENVVSEIKESGGKAIAVQADVANPYEVEQLVQKTSEEFGGIFGIVNNAGSEISHKQFIDTDWEEFEKHFQVQIKGIYNTVKAASPYMVEKKSGSIVNIASAYTFGAPPTRLAPYVTAKHAVIGLTRSLAVELSRYGIRVNAVSPGFTETDLTRDLPKIFHEAEAAKAPHGRLNTPDDIARVVALLMSDDSESKTGDNVPVLGEQDV